MKDIFWIQHDDPPRLAIVARPRGDDWLEEDLSNLKRGRIEILVSLLMPEEAIDLGLAAEGDVARNMGIEFISYPIPDRTTPIDAKSFHLLIARLADAVRAGKYVGAHCRGCIGRATVTTAAVLVHLGFEPADALAMIEEARECPVPDTLEQQNWILQLEPER
jgi:protein-tyrosine phosphatase